MCSINPVRQFLLMNLIHFPPRSFVWLVKFTECSVMFTPWSLSVFCIPVNSAVDRRAEAHLSVVATQTVVSASRALSRYMYLLMTSQVWSSKTGSCLYRLDYKFFQVQNGRFHHVYLEKETMYDHGVFDIVLITAFTIYTQFIENRLTYTLIEPYMSLHWE